MRAALADDARARLRRAGRRRLSELGAEPGLERLGGVLAEACDATHGVTAQAKGSVDRAR
jgi:hypothetical protein